MWPTFKVSENCIFFTWWSMAVFIGNSVFFLQCNYSNKLSLISQMLTGFRWSAKLIFRLPLPQCFEYFYRKLTKTSSQIVHSWNLQHPAGFLEKDVNSCRHVSVSFVDMISLVQFAATAVVCSQESAVESCIHQPHQRVQHCSVAVTHNILHVSGFTLTLKCDTTVCQHGNCSYRNLNVYIIKLQRFI